MSENVRLRINGLSEAYSRKSARGSRTSALHWALQEIDLVVGAGEMLGVIGANGSGKSTLLQCIAGVLRPSRGKIEARGRVGSLIDLTVGFHRELSGRENITISGVLGGLTRSEVGDRIARIAGFAELDDDQLDQPMFTYSAGMSLRLGIAVVVNCDVGILVVDEVLAVGDAPFQRKCVEKVHSMQADGCAVVMVSHDMDLIARHCDRAIVLDDGRISFEGPPRVAIDHYTDLSGGELEPQQLSTRTLYATGQIGDKRRRRRGA